MGGYSESMSMHLVDEKSEQRIKVVFSFKSVYFQMSQASLEIYRKTTLGMTLVETIAELIGEDKLPGDGELGIRILTEYDQTISKVFETKIPAKAKITSRLSTYRYIDSMWLFELTEAKIKVNGSGQGSFTNVPEMQIDKIKVVCVDSKVVKAQQ
eukprot:TRINITY_DN33703_c0_g2_i1.p1 TRINITY_DN33703_c0_g2~~TRINITY_DN33703_c0_g2_i1.p1  ORF type:complete len:162 (-),score=11.42 TRINITY_DN33703_c0_g2_i1:613-1077(-)